MTNNLEKDLIADGFTPSPIGLKGLAEWTGWTAPSEDDRLGAETTPNTYEIYYDLITAAMYAQMDDPPWDREHSGCRALVGGRCSVLQSWVKEYRAVVDCWRSTSQVAPAPGAR